ncbi:hypothetical protein QBC45DRAFT_457913 [Copromyces sp. CBS 386.78]|nr:hypothetical protein QBC45DRAFT_457913 [Copromyces sp. CBS 386.78]
MFHKTITTIDDKAAFPDPEPPVPAKRGRGRPRKDGSAPRPSGKPTTVKKALPKPDDEYDEPYYERQKRKRKASEELPDQQPSRRSKREKKLRHQSLDMVKLVGLQGEGPEEPVDTTTTTQEPTPSPSPPPSGESEFIRDSIIVRAETPSGQHQHHDSNKDNSNKDNSNDNDDGRLDPAHPRPLIHLPSPDSCPCQNCNSDDTDKEMGRTGPVRPRGSGDLLSPLATAPPSPSPQPQPPKPARVRSPSPSLPLSAGVSTPVRSYGDSIGGRPAGTPVRTRGGSVLASPAPRDSPVLKAAPVLAASVRPPSVISAPADPSPALPPLVPPAIHDPALATFLGVAPAPATNINTNNIPMNNDDPLGINVPLMDDLAMGMDQFVNGHYINQRGDAHAADPLPLNAWTQALPEEANFFRAEMAAHPRGGMCPACIARYGNGYDVLEDYFDFMRDFHEPQCWACPGYGYPGRSTNGDGPSFA